MRLEDFRKQYPQYNDISDEDLAKGLHRRFYSDIPFEDFSKRVGFTPETGIARRVFGDVPVGIAQGATTGIRMISDAFGAGNPISESLKGVEDYLGGLLSAQATNNLEAMAKIIKESEDKGVLEQVKAGFKGLTEAPVEVVSQFLGTAAPTILAGVGGALAKVGATGIGAIQAGTGATMGAGLIKGNIYEVVKDELTKAGVDPKIAEERATFAQNYTGENWDQILLGTGLGGAAALGPLERIFARAPAIPTGIAAKNMVTRGVAAGVMEGAPEFTQAFQEQVASNIALQREGFDVPTYRGAVANATLEGLAGFGIGAPIGMMSRGQKVGEPAPPPPEAQPPGAIPPAAPPAGAIPPGEQPPGVPPVGPGQPPRLMPGMVEGEPELTPEEEEELQAQIAGATAPPPVAPPAVSPDVAAQVQQLNARLAQVEAKRQDPTLSIDDYEAIENLDREEREIVQQIQALTRPPEKIVDKQQIPPPQTVAKQQIEPTIEDQLRAQKSEERRERQAEQEAKKGEFVLQNRDRAGTASLQQMQGIANAPDYGRAGFSRTPDGAPIVAFGDFSPEQLGREDVVTTARGRKIPVQYAVMEADDILTSNDFDGRSNPKYGDKNVPGTRAIAGNGRVTGIREAFKYPGRTEKYVEDMLADTSLHGVDQDVIGNMEKPILVRIMPKEGLTRDIGDELNMSGMLELSPVEQARNDLNRVDFDSLAFDEDGEITNASLGQFINAQPVEERAKLVERGLPTRQARQRLENAIFARAYNDDDLIAMFAQADDAEARLVINALAQVAPQMAKLEGAGDLDIRDIVTDAAKLIISGKRRGLKLKELAAQVDMTVDPDTRIIVDLFAQNPRSNKGAIEALNNAADIAYRESIRPEEGLFGAEPKMERRELVERMRRGYEPRRTQDVAQAQRPGAAPSDVERKAESSAAAVPPADQGFALTGQTKEELAALERKERTGEAQREKEEREAKEIADREREIFALQPTKAAPAPAAPRPTGDLFGATGMVDQPPRTAAAAPATPIEEAAIETKKSPFKIGERVVYNKPESKIFPDDPAAKIGATVDFIYNNNRVAIVRDDTGETDVVPAEDLSKPTEEAKIPPIEEAIDPEAIKNTIDVYVSDIRRGTSDFAPTAYDEANNTLTYVETWKTDEKIPREDFDELVAGASKTDTAKGAKYSILVKDTPTEALILTFQPRGLTPTQKYVDVFMQMEETTVETPERTYKEEIEFRTKEKKLDDPGVSKKIQEARGVSKPVADAYIRAMKAQIVALANFTYGKGTEEEFSAAVKEVRKIENRIQGIEKRGREGKPPTETVTPSEDTYIGINANGEKLYDRKDGSRYRMRMDRADRPDGYPDFGGDLRPALPENVKTGSVIEAIDLPDNMQVRILKATDGFSVQMYDKDSENVVDKSVTIFKESVFEDNAFESAKEYADNLVKEVRQETKEVEGQQREYMLVPFNRKDQAKSMGAKFDSELKLWYHEGEKADRSEFVLPSFKLDPMQTFAKKEIAEGAGRNYSRKTGNDYRVKQLAIGDKKVFALTDKNGNFLNKSIEQEAELAKKGPTGPTPGELKNIQYWQANVAPAIRDYLEAYKKVGAERLERSNIKPAGVSPKQWLIQLRDQESKFEKGRKVSETGIQLLSKKDLWPTETGDGEVLRKAMLKAIQELKKAPGYSSNWIDNMELGSYDGVSGYAPVADKTVFGIASDGIDGYEVDPSQVPNGSDAFQYVVGRVEKDGKEEVYRRRADERGTFGGWRVETSVDKLLPKEPAAPKEPSAGPTFAGMQAEIERLKKEQAALGIPETPTPVRDEKAARAEREAKAKKKEAKLVKQATRSDIEFARFDDLDTDPIQATPEQLKMAQDLAAKVDGELVFFDKDLELGLVVVPAEGFDNYFPIHDGKISKVDVSDYTGLSTLDKSFLNRIARALKVFRDTKPGLDEFLNVEIDMPGDRQESLFGSTSEAKKISEAMEPKGKKLPPGRSPELTAAARSVRAGTMTAEEYNKLVDVYKPIPMYAEPLRPATAEQVYDALDTKKREQINPDIPNGTKVGLRLDIPAFNRKGVFVVSIHQKRTASAPGKVIGYGSVAKAKNVTFGVGNQLKALDIAAGEAKDALQTIEGEYINITPEQAFAEAQRAIKDPSYVQVGIDPTRHAYFYDRRTTLPVVSAEEVIQIGNMILAKKPVFGAKSDFLYNIESQGVAGGSLPRSKKEIKEFLDRLSAEEDAKREVERQERIAYYASIRQKEVALQRRVRNYGSTIEIQRELNNLNQLAKELKEDIDLDKRPVYRAEEFLNQARAALEGAKFPYKEAKISPDVFAVIQAVYMDDPKLLEGLRLSIKPEFSPDETLLRRAHGMPQAAGAFVPFQRLVKLYTGTRGVDEPITIRHELTHTLEQMMTPAQRQAVISSYFKALEKAVKKHKDARSQEFFEKVTEFLNNPTRKNQIALNSALPSYDFYQYVNPSEYWAVNAEKLMAQRLGPSWERFKKAVRKLFEKMKDIFGFDNRFAVHQVFDQVMSGSKERLTKKMLADYIKSSGDRFDFLENIEDDAELMRRSGRADTPMLDVAPMKRILIRGATNAKESFKEMVENPSEILRMTFNPINRGIIYLRNKNVWFGTGINEADRIRYNGQVKVSNLIATASLALDNMIRGGNIATQVLFQGGIEFNPKTLMFGAIKKAMSMANVYRAEAAIKKRLGEQLGTNIIQGYLEAKRSRSIKNEVISRQKTLDKLQELVDDKVAELKALDADPNASEKEIAKVNKELRTLFREFQDAKRDLDTIKKIAEDKVSMSEEMIEEFISREKVHPELREIMDNFNAVNKNLLAFWRQVGLISENRYNTLANIKDYVPWYRIMNDEEDVHSPLQATTRSATNIGKEKLFGPGKPSVVNDFIVEENQKVFKIQPGRVNAVKLEGKKLKPEDYEVTPQGEITLKVDYKPGDVLIVETQREIENMIDNMTRNVMRMTMNGLRQYAAQRIVSEYATRDADGKIMTFGKTDIAKGRFDFIRDGRRTVVEIQDPLLAEGVLGMETVGMKMLWEPLATAANFTRRTITLSPVFQVKQVFKDAPTAALVTGVKSPSRLIGGVYKGFIDAIRDSDPAAGILRSVGIGGFYSPARTPEADVKRQIGIINNNTYDYVMKALDHFGDSSDMAQRIAIYNRVMAETGDEALAMYQAANVINFLRHGSGPVAQALVRTVPFLNAYAQSIDVLYNALVGGGLRGKDRAAALRQLAVTGSLLAGTTLLYAMLVGDDDDYMKMDDQSKVRNYMIPGTDVVLPMNTSAAFFFKAIPELTYNAFMSQGTENAVDEKRLRRAMKEAAVDLLLGPTPVPSAAKPIIEISLNYDFFTSRPVVPAGLKDLDAYQQYDMRTSEAAKLMSALTGTKENRLLNPVEADHLIRGIFGTAGGMVAWSSNLIGEASEIRPEMGLKEMPITGAFLRPEVPRGREDLFYALKESTDRKFKTFNRLADRDVAEAEAYLNKHPNLIAFYDYTSEMDTQLKELNAAIRFIAETTDRSYTPEIKRKEIQELLNLKQEILEGVEMFRREAYAD